MPGPTGIDPTDSYEDDPRVVAAVKGFMAQLESGRAPDLVQYLSQHAAIAEHLRPALEGLAMLHGASVKPKTLAIPDAEFTAKPIGDFQIVGELGRGGMGVVYEAIQLSLGRRVALKVLPFASGLDASRLQRFRNEAHAAAQLHHANIVPVHAVGSDRGVQYYAMQLIEGQSLAELISALRTANHHTDDGRSSIRDKGGTSSDLQPVVRESSRSRPDKLQPSQSTLLSTTGEKKKHYRSMVQLAFQACMALEHAHQCGVVHRDIKPGNLLLDLQGKLWVTDFGLAQFEQAEHQLTRSGDALGTARYMSPEQAAGNRLILDHRTDIYSLGVTLYEMLTLVPAIRGNDYRQMLNLVVESEPLTLKLVDPSLPTELDTIVRKSIAKEPSQRYASAAAFGADLQAWLDDKPIAAKPPTVWDRIAKWRRRNHRLVNLAALMLVAASLGLLATTLIVLHEQQQTKLALEKERASFDQARRAVDIFSELSETELAYRPEFQSLRRRILETSLAFYRDFISQRAGDLSDSQELQAASAKVQRMVEDLQLLDDVAPLLLLVDQRVRDELKIEPDVGDALMEQIEFLQLEREELGDHGGLMLAGVGIEIAESMQAFVVQVNQQLEPAQLWRLQQISRQQNLPFTFLTTEVSDALHLSSDQRQQISRIIQEERPAPPGPGPGPGPGRDPGPGPGSGSGSGRDGLPRVDFGPRYGPPRGPAAGGDRGRRGPPPRSLAGRGMEFAMEQSIKKTVDRVLELLTPVQVVTWNELVGEPYTHRVQRRLDNPMP